MAVVKRKKASDVRVTGNNSHKKPRREVVKAARPILEAETDSDPIIESDTTEHSGDDDGVSWPEDDNGDAEQISADEKYITSSGTGRSIKEKHNGISNCMKHPISFTSAELTTRIANSSKESHAKQKAMAQERKASKPNADSIARSKKLWERLRRKSHVPLTERKELVAELFDIITGRVKDFVLKHDSVRVIQTALKYANPEQRKMIAQELRGEYRGLAESRYAKFLIGKLLVHGDEEIRDLVVPEFYGHIRRMIKHPEASWILDDVYRGVATPSQKAIMLREWYGAEFAIFKPDKQSPVSGDLRGLLAGSPEKRTPIIRALHDLINQLVQKQTTGFTMLHDAMLQYFLNVHPGSEEATEFIELLKSDEEGDLLKNLAFTKSGARLVCLVLAYGSAKDRKQILKTYKNTMQTLAYDTNGHRVLLAAYDVIDDTILTSKSIFPELLGKESAPEEQHHLLMAYVTNPNARVPILYLFAGNAKSVLPVDDLALLDEIHEIRKTASKKNAETRRKELVTAISPRLLSFVAAKAEDLVTSSFGCQFICEILLGGIGDREEAISAVADLPNKSAEVQASLNSAAGGRMLKTLVLGGRFNPRTKAIDLADPPLGFHDMLYVNIKPAVVEWATSRNSFVIVGLLEARGFSKREELVKTLKKHTRLLEKAVKGVVVSGVVSTEEVKGSKKAETGNKGAKLLVEIIEE
ncbi:pumilio domain member 6 [Toensbergia leucococca]|nr:pumilio domain member 6 [Toensbergia leucococca]